MLRQSRGELRHHVRAEGWQPYSVPDVHAARVRAVLRRRAAELRRGVEGSGAQGEGGVCETVAAGAEAVCEVDDGGGVGGDNYCVADSNHTPSNPSRPSLLMYTVTMILYQLLILSLLTYFNLWVASRFSKLRWVLVLQKKSDICLLTKTPQQVSPSRTFF